MFSNKVPVLVVMFKKTDLENHYSLLQEEAIRKANKFKELLGSFAQKIHSANPPRLNMH